jgi:hypothetical protein
MIALLFIGWMFGSGITLTLFMTENIGLRSWVDAVLILTLWPILLLIFLVQKIGKF